MSKIGKVTVPRTVEAAADRLTSLGGLVTATEWERAAIVYAYAERSRPGPKGSSGNSPRTLSCREFAALGIVGLRDHHTVAFYRDAWQQAVDAGDAEPTKPGGRVALPDRPWPPNTAVGLGKSAEGTASAGRAAAIREQAERDGVGASKAVDIASNPKAMAAAIRSDPATADAAQRALLDVARTRQRAPAERSQEEIERIERDDAWLFYDAIMRAAHLMADAAEASKGLTRLDPDRQADVLECLERIRFAADVCQQAMAGAGLISDRDLENLIERNSND